MKPISKFLLAGFLLVIFVAVLESCQKEEPIVEQTQVENLSTLNDTPDGDEWSFVPNCGNQVRYKVIVEAGQWTLYAYQKLVGDEWVDITGANAASVCSQYQDGSGVQFMESGFLQLTRADQSTICSDPNSQQFVFYTNVDGDITYYHWNGSDLITLGENGEQFYNDKCNQWNRSPLNYELTISGDTPESVTTCTNPSNPNHTVTIIQRGMQCSAKETINGVTSNIPCFGEGGGLDKCSMWADGISQGLEDALNSSTRASGGWMHYCGQVQFRDVWLGGAQMRREFRWPDGNGGWVTSFDAQYVHSNLCE